MPQRVLPVSASSSKASAGGGSTKEQEKEIASLMEAFKDVQERHAQARAAGLRRRSLLDREGAAAGEAAAAAAESQSN